MSLNSCVCGCLLDVSFLPVGDILVDGFVQYSVTVITHSNLGADFFSQSDAFPWNNNAYAEFFSSEYEWVHFGRTLTFSGASSKHLHALWTFILNVPVQNEISFQFSLDTFFCLPISHHSVKEMHQQELGICARQLKKTDHFICSWSAWQV